MPAFACDASSHAAAGRPQKGCPDGKEYYGFRDLRRAFATMNAANALQHLMRYKSNTTMNPAVAALFVPELKAKASSG